MIRIHTLIAPITISFLFLMHIGSLSASTGKDDTTANHFSQEETGLIMNGHATDPMRVLQTDNLNDSLTLRTRSEYIKPATDDLTLHTFISKLFATVTDSASLGVGIAAPQVGILKNIIYVQRFDKEGYPFELYFNPEVIQYSVMKQDCREGCLSIPNIIDTTRNRSYTILLEYDRPDGTHHAEMVEGFTAVIFQHEIDHLNGILFIDHLVEQIPARLE